MLLEARCQRFTQSRLHAVRPHLLPGGGAPKCTGLVGGAGTPQSLGQLTEGSLVIKGPCVPGHTLTLPWEFCSSAIILLRMGKLRLNNVDP